MSVLGDSVSDRLKGVKLASVTGPEGDWPSGVVSVTGSERWCQ